MTNFFKMILTRMKTHPNWPLTRKQKVRLHRRITKQYESEQEVLRLHALKMLQKENEDSYNK